MVTLPVEGRVFTHRDRVMLGDVSPGGRARLDAFARWLQDAAYDDALDSGIDQDGAWIVRRMALRVLRFPRLLDPIDVDTFCSGTAALWAERSSLVRSGGERVAHAVALWVHLEPDGSRPRPLPGGFHAVYGASAGGRRVRARLHHPAAPPPDATARPWRFRAADLDPAGHVNNAVFWAALEEELVTDEPARGLEAEVEHRAPAGNGAGAIHQAGAMRWITAADGAVTATFRLAG
jgi:acyl-ACP thioesterase